jgi:hypothetical protein
MPRSAHVAAAPFRKMAMLNRPMGLLRVACELGKQAKQIGKEQA